MIYFPSQVMLKKLSTVVKKRREELHISQSELSKGICTQTTISTLENNSYFNKWEIIPEIIKRLNIDLDKFEEEYSYRYGETNLKKVEGSLLNHEFVDAKSLLTDIKRENIDSKELLSKYYCYQGILQLYTDTSLDEALSNFSTAIDEHLTHNNQWTISWSYLGMALSYKRLNMKKRTDYYLKLAIKELDKLFSKFESGNDLCHITRLSLIITIFAYSINDKQLAIIQSKKTILFLKKHFSFYCLKDFYYIQGLALKNSDEDESLTFLTRAKQLEELYSYSSFQLLLNLCE